MSPAEDQEQPGESPDAEGRASETEAPKKPAARAKKPAAEKTPAQQAAKPAAKAEKPAAKVEKPAAKAKEAKTPVAEQSAAGEQSPAGESAAEKPTAKKAPAAKPAVKGAAKGSEEAAKPRAAQAKPVVGRATVRAHARYVRTSARKARMVCGHIRGKSVQEARAILAFTPRDVARDWSKLLESAVANAENNHELLEDDLVVREAYADEGPTIKRFRPRAMGRATPIRKRTSHLTITLTPRP
jgi:ribosomal protein L22